MSDSSVSDSSFLSSFTEGKQFKFPDSAVKEWWANFSARLAGLKQILSWWNWRRALLVGLMVLGLVATVGGFGYLWWWTNQLPVNFISSEGSQLGQNGFDKQGTVGDGGEPAASAEAEFGWVWIDVGGQVKKPGLYRLAAGSRLAAAVAAAGGFTDQADPVFISQQLNLAQPVADGDKLYIISQAEQELVTTVNSTNATDLTDQNQASSAQSNPAAQSSQISINTASQTELESLPGIGEKRATDIIDHRPYTSTHQLIDDQIITAAVWEDIQGLIKL